MDTNKKSANCSVKEGTVDARVKYNKQIIVLPTIRFLSAFCISGIIK